MPIQPKFGIGRKEFARSARQFTDREEYINTFFDTILRNKKDKHNILVYYGIGGIGKTSLRKELEKQLNFKYPESIWTSIDFDLSSYRQDYTALYYLRKTLRDKYKINFPTFEIAYTVYWRKTNPHTSLNKESLPLLDEGGLVSDLAMTIGNIPLVGILPGIAKTVLKGHRYFKEWWTKRGQKELYDLPDLEAKDILERLPMFFASDLKDYLNSYNQLCVIFLDTYEALWENVKSEGGFFMRDDWIRELVANLPELLFVICGREKIRWEELDEEWEEIIEQHILGNLSRIDSISFLNKSGIKNEKIIENIYDASRGVPLYLDLAVDTYHQIKTNQDREPEAIDFVKTQTHILDRFLKNLDIHEIETLKVLSSVNFWDREIFELLINKFNIGLSITSMQNFCRFSFIEELSKNRKYVIHDLIRDSLQKKLDDDTKKASHKLLFEFYNNRLENLELIDITEENNEDLSEAFYHGKISLGVDYFHKWFIEKFKLFNKAAKWKLLIDLYEELIAIIKNKNGENNSDYSQSINNLGKLFMNIGKYEKAKNLFLKAAAIRKNLSGENNVENADSLHNLATVYIKLGFYEQAVKAIERSIQIQRKTLNINSYEYAQSLNDLAYAFHEMGKYNNAVSLLNESANIRKNLLGENNPEYAQSLHNIACIYYQKGEYDKAKSMFQRAIEIRKNTLGENHPQYADSINDLANVYTSMEKIEDGIRLYNKAIEIRKNILGENHPIYADSINSLACLYGNIGENKKAINLYKQAIDIYLNTLGANHPTYANSINNIACVYNQEGEYIKAKELFEKAIEIRLNTLGKNHPQYAVSLNNLASVYCSMGEYIIAEEYSLQALRICENFFDDDHIYVKDALIQLKEIYERSNNIIKMNEIQKKLNKKSE